MSIFFIPFNKGGGVVVDWDFQSIIHCINWFTDKNGYALSNIPYNGKQKRIRMHRLLTNFPQETDHINGNKLDNRINNLRESDRRKNMQNRIEHRNGKLVGTYFREDMNKWRAECVINGTYHHIGWYDSEIKGHNAYKKYVEGL